MRLLNQKLHAMFNIGKTEPVTQTPGISVHEKAGYTINGLII